MSDISIVFGPGASALSNELAPNALNTESAPSDTSPGKTGTSTPLRKRSRGRRRTRNSGRSSLSSPSPIRPPSQKVRLDGGEMPEGQIGSDQSQQKDLLDPGDQLSDQNATIVKELHQLCDSGDSGDWGDTSIEDEGGNLGINVDISVTKTEDNRKEGVVTDISSVEQVPAQGPSASTVEPDPEAQQGV